MWSNKEEIRQRAGIARILKKIPSTRHNVFADTGQTAYEHGQAQAMGLENSS